MRGWKTNCDSENFILRDMCLKHLDLNIIGIAETHLKGSDVLKVEQYTWFGNNRQNIDVEEEQGLEESSF